MGARIEIFQKNQKFATLYPELCGKRPEPEMMVINAPVLRKTVTA